MLKGEIALTSEFEQCLCRQGRPLTLMETTIQLLFSLKMKIWNTIKKKSPELDFFY